MSKPVSIGKKFPSWLSPKIGHRGLLYRTDKIEMSGALSKKSGTTWYFLLENGVMSQSNDPVDFLETIKDQSELLKFAAWLSEKGQL